jgi:23S rRNA pseudouridine2604 synthase
MLLSKHPRKYAVWTQQSLSPKDIQQLQSGLFILGQLTLPTKVTPISSKCFHITLNEGKNRQIRRMLTTLGHQVIRLKRLSHGPYHLNKLKPGEFTSLHIPKSDIKL